MTDLTKAMISKEEAARRLIRFAFSDDDGDPDLSALPEFAEAIRKAEQRGAERERAAVVSALRGSLDPAMADYIESGKHLKERE